MDTKYRNTDAGQVGPLEQRLQGFGEILCLVVGQYGEISQDFHDPLNQLASAKAKHISLLEGRPCQFLNKAFSFTISGEDCLSPL